MARKAELGEPKRAVAYLRCSTDAQELGPEAQRAAVDRWAAVRGVQVVATFEDGGVSGGAAIDRRPGLLAALGALRQHRAGLLVAAKRDRFARDVVIAALIGQAAKRAGATVTTADGASDGSGPEGELLKGIVDVFASYERAAIRARTRAALAVKKTRGQRVGQVPYGQRVGPDGIHLNDDPAEQAIIAAITTMRTAGLSLRGIVEECKRRTLISRVGRPFGVTQIARLVSRSTNCA